MPVEARRCTGATTMEITVSKFELVARVDGDAGSG